MVVAVLVMELFIPEASSLKEKRMVLQSLITKISKKYNVSIVETQYQDKWQRSEIGIAKISPDQKSIEIVFNNIDRLIETDGRAELIRTEFEYFK